MDDDEIHAAGAEQFVMVVVIRTKVTTIVIAPQETRFAEILVVEGRGAIGVTTWRLIVVTHRDAIRHTFRHPRGGWILDHVESSIRVLPFDLELIAMLCTVTQLSYKDNVS